jgi:hypothetical protein
MLLSMIKRRANTFFTIVQRKVLRAAGAFVTTMNRRRQERSINRNSAMGMAAAMGMSFERRTISCVAETRKIRYENVELD